MDLSSVPYYRTVLSAWYNRAVLYGMNCKFTVPCRPLRPVPHCRTKGSAERHATENGTCAISNRSPFRAVLLENGKFFLRNEPKTAIGVAQNEKRYAEKCLRTDMGHITIIRA